MQEAILGCVSYRRSSGVCPTDVASECFSYRRTSGDCACVSPSEAISSRSASPVMVEHACCDSGFIFHESLVAGILVRAKRYDFHRKYLRHGHTRSKSKGGAKRHNDAEFDRLLLEFRVMEPARGCVEPWRRRRRSARMHRRYCPPVSRGAGGDCANGDVDASPRVGASCSGIEYFPLPRGVPRRRRGGVDPSCAVCGCPVLGSRSCTASGDVVHWGCCGGECAASVDVARWRRGRQLRHRILQRSLWPRKQRPQCPSRWGMRRARRAATREHRLASMDASKNGDFLVPRDGKEEMRIIAATSLHGTMLHPCDPHCDHYPFHYPFIDMCGVTLRECGSIFAGWPEKCLQCAVLGIASGESAFLLEGFLRGTCDNASRSGGCTDATEVHNLLSVHRGLLGVGLRIDVFEVWSRDAFERGHVIRRWSLGCSSVDTRCVSVVGALLWSVSEAHVWVLDGWELCGFGEISVASATRGCPLSFGAVGGRRAKRSARPKTRVSRDDGIGGVGSVEDDPPVAAGDCVPSPVVERAVERDLVSGEDVVNGDTVVSPAVPAVGVVDRGSSPIGVDAVPVAAVGRCDWGRPSR